MLKIRSFREISVKRVGLSLLSRDQVWELWDQRCLNLRRESRSRGGLGREGENGYRKSCGL